MKKGITLVFVSSLLVVSRFFAAGTAAASEKDKKHEAGSRQQDFVDAARQGAGLRELQEIKTKIGDIDYLYASQALVQAVVHGHLETVNILLDSFKIDPNGFDYQHSPLRRAIFSNRPLIVQTLLDHGANCNGSATNGDTSLHFAAYFNRPNIVRALLEAGANPYVLNRSDQTFIDVASNPAHMRKILDSFLARGSKAAAQPAPEPSRPAPASSS
ncbi:MAG TPA: ankyrin repeat domain-containing protein, partial [Candidatus Limnocylindria bacterium]|nr:ankyrin repeat domain-containing protein [Candidatus Limnocylindria bacterium]